MPARFVLMPGNPEMVWREILIHRNQIGPTSHFTNDLGLDSLDVVEVVMAVEEVLIYFPLASSGA